MRSWCPTKFKRKKPKFPDLPSSADDAHPRRSLSDRIPRHRSIESPPFTTKKPSSSGDEAGGSGGGGDRFSAADDHPPRSLSDLTPRRRRFESPSFTTKKPSSSGDVAGGAGGAGGGGGDRFSADDDHPPRSFSDHTPRPRSIDSPPFTTKKPSSSGDAGGGGGDRFSADDDHPSRSFSDHTPRPRSIDSPPFTTKKPSSSGDAGGGGGDRFSAADDHPPRSLSDHTPRRRSIESPPFTTEKPSSSGDAGGGSGGGGDRFSADDGHPPCSLSDHTPRPRSVDSPPFTTEKPSSHGDTSGGGGGGGGGDRFSAADDHPPRSLSDHTPRPRSIDSPPFTTEKLSSHGDTCGGGGSGGGDRFSADDDHPPRSLSDHTPRPRSNDSPPFTTEKPSSHGDTSGGGGGGGGDLFDFSHPLPLPGVLDLPQVAASVYDEAPDLAFIRHSEPDNTPRDRNVISDLQRPQSVQSSTDRTGCSAISVSPNNFGPGTSSHGQTSNEAIYHQGAFTVSPKSSKLMQDDLRSPLHRLPLPPGSPSSSAPRAVQSLWKKGELLGSGTFGNVYLGFNSESGQMCAIKDVTVFSDDPKSIECLKQLSQEIAFLSKLSHPNIVQYYGCEMVDNTLSVYLEYVPGGSIYKLLQEYGPFSEPVIQSFAAQILSGLAYLHGRNTIHRDIKGANILVGPNGEIKLADFGMAKYMSAFNSITSSKGSAYWVAPEVLRDGSGRLPSSDIWSLGCTIFEMATSKPPWSQCEMGAAMHNMLIKDMPELPEHISPDVKSFVKLCWCRDPSARPTADQLLQHPFVRDQAANNKHSIPSRDILQAPDRRSTCNVLSGIFIQKFYSTS